MHSYKFFAQHCYCKVCIVRRKLFSQDGSVTIYLLWIWKHQKPLCRLICFVLWLFKDCQLNISLHKIGSLIYRFNAYWKYGNYGYYQEFLILWLVQAKPCRELFLSKFHLEACTGCCWYNAIQRWHTSRTRSTTIVNNFGWINSFLL